ncbi:MAG: protein tyrosine phosphatase [Enterobacteriaceae bacterium]|jgi:protein-tyrosine phosphatase|nr:protein tyrosine phosphatase [Enterobacteriaceae bacterium]
MFNSILVVCSGNICRSPIGERLLQAQLPDKTIHSAGLSALVDHPAESTAREIALQHGLSLDGHRARQLNNAMCKQYDLILVMEKRHLHDVCQIAPEAQGKIMLFGHWKNRQELTDPYGKSRELFELVFQQLVESTIMWIQALKS